jgi:hypothetical protein
VQSQLCGTQSDLRLCVRQGGWSHLGSDLGLCLGLLVEIVKFKSMCVRVVWDLMC